MRSMANMNRVMSIFCAVECYSSSNNFNVKPEGLLAVYELLKRWTQPQSTYINIYASGTQLDIDIQKQTCC